jgi:hypothetical protein
MKKLLSLLLFLSLSAYSQEAERIKIFKFHPFSLVTGSLNASQEYFSKDQKKSFIVGLGLRYVNRKATQNSYLPGSNSIDPYNKWQGLNLSLERRFYVPGFYSGENFSFISKKALFGVYLSAGAKLEYNVNEFDNTFINTTFSQQGNTPSYEKIIDTGKYSYLGVVPNLNMGMQFTLFQNLYLDINIGGAIRFIDKTTLRESRNTGSSTYYYNNGLQKEAIETFIIKEGVQGNFGFGLGLRL